MDEALYNEFKAERDRAIRRRDQATARAAATTGAEHERQTVHATFYDGEAHGWTMAMYHVKHRGHVSSEPRTT